MSTRLLETHPYHPRSHSPLFFLVLVMEPRTLCMPDKLSALPLSYTPAPSSHPSSFLPSCSEAQSLSLQANRVFSSPLPGKGQPCVDASPNRKRPSVLKGRGRHTKVPSPEVALLLASPFPQAPQQRGCWDWKPLSTYARRLRDKG
jgi:hypothetical protein